MRCALVLAACGGPPGPGQAAPREAEEPGPDDEPRTIAEVVGEDAAVDCGLFVVHRTDEKLYFEISEALLGRELLVISRIARVPTGVSPAQSWIAG